MKCASDRSGVHVHAGGCRRLKTDVGLSLPKKKEVIVYTSLTKQQKAYYEGAARTLMVCNVLTCVDRMLVGLLGEGHAHFRRPTDTDIC